MVPYHHTIIISSILIHQCLALNDVIYKTNLTLDGTGRSFLLIALPRKKKKRDAAVHTHQNHHTNTPYPRLKHSASLY